MTVQEEVKELTSAPVEVENKLPNSFFWGCATAAYQVEGMRRDSVRASRASLLRLYFYIYIH